MAKKILKVKTDYGTYECVFEPEKDMGGYVAVARKVNGAVTWGKNLAEAQKMAKEVIEGVIEANAVAKSLDQGFVKLSKKSSTLA
ncbi:MAG: type II toxin-antitoxin system HicB family antitoxin [bacterium]|nr:type II toxin-antitoxin system HicB family antitoxin [bacterium]